jgi:hypothetical protein
MKRICISGESVSDQAGYIYFGALQAAEKRCPASLQDWATRSCLTQDCRPGLTSDVPSGLARSFSAAPKALWLLEAVCDFFRNLLSARSGFSDSLCLFPPAGP